MLPSNRRRNRIGITPELPTWRSRGWNLALLTTEAALVGWGHTVAGLAWTTVALTLTGVAVLGAGLVTYVVLIGTPRAQRRHDALLRAYLAANTTSGKRAEGKGVTGRRVRVVSRVADSQLETHPTTPSNPSKPTRSVSRTR